MHILMIAAENDALPGGKVGGLADVVRDLPPALARNGQQVSVITPGYGALATKENRKNSREFSVQFCGRSETIQLIEVTPRTPCSNTSHFVLEHWLFSAGGPGSIYVMDHYGPFATDAHKFALFSVAVCQAVVDNLLGKIDVMHCHDWHASNVLILQQYAEQFKVLKKYKTVFSIHNLSMQGVRPFAGDESSLESWYQPLTYDSSLISDPFSHDCVNFMRAGINLAEKVHVVSPTYAQEILAPSDWQNGYVGGEGLEADLQRVNAKGDLVGILNGCEYPDINSPAVVKKEVLQLIDSAITRWANKNPAQSASYYFALRRINEWQKKRKSVSPIFASIGRLTPQKLMLLTQSYQQSTVLNALLDKIENGLFIVLGNGDAEYDRLFTQIMASRTNFLYLCGYSQELADALYEFCDLFIMPSMYEPCGISQMLAMRAGVPCLASEVGGLKDTVIDGVNGITFGGQSLSEKSEALLESADRALAAYADSSQWATLVAGAKASKFSWDKSVQDYVAKLYR